jgi:nicotinamidase-related amidase
MAKTALIIVDMVKDFTDENGLVYYPQNKEVLPKIEKVNKASKEHNVQVIFMRHSYRKDKYDKNLINMRPNCISGSGGDEIDNSLTVNEKTDYIIKKRRYSAFFGTDLDLILRENNIEHVVIVGTKTNCCIRATVTDAYYLNYDVIVLEDCVATNDEIVQRVHLNDIRKYFGKVMSSDQFIKGLQEGEYS